MVAEMVAKDRETTLIPCLPVEYRYNLVRRFHISEDAVHRLKFALMRVARNFCYRIADDDPPVIVFDPAADGIGHTDTGGHPHHDTGRNPHIAEHCVEFRIGEAAE